MDHRLKGGLSMSYSQEHMDDLKKTFGSEVAVISEAGYEYVYIRGLKMPPGCTPAVTDALLCPVQHFSAWYPSRLFLKDRVHHPKQTQGQPNWQPSQYILGYEWHNFSYKEVVTGKFSDMVLMHLRGLYKV
jgi:hypothetical protein